MPRFQRFKKRIQRKFSNKSQNARTAEERTSFLVQIPAEGTNPRSEQQENVDPAARHIVDIERLMLTARDCKQCTAWDYDAVKLLARSEHTAPRLLVEYLAAVINHGVGSD